MLAGMLKFTTEKLKEDNVDILHVEVTKKSMAQKDVCKGVLWEHPDAFIV